MTDRPTYTARPAHVLHTYKGRETKLNHADCDRIRLWLERQIESPAWSDGLTEARKQSLASLNAAMAESFTGHQQNEEAA
jgi:hypothetical protein